MLQLRWWSCRGSASSYSGEILPRQRPGMRRPGTEEIQCPLPLHGMAMLRRGGDAGHNAGHTAVLTSTATVCLLNRSELVASDRQQEEAPIASAARPVRRWSALEANDKRPTTSEGPLLVVLPQLAVAVLTSPCGGVRRPSLESLGYGGLLHHHAPRECAGISRCPSGTVRSRPSQQDKGWQTGRLPPTLPPLPRPCVAATYKVQLETAIRTMCPAERGNTLPPTVAETYR